MNYILFDSKEWKQLLPLTFTRPVCEIRIGILTIKKKWEIFLSRETSYLTQDYLKKKFPVHIDDRNILINGSLLPDKDIMKAIAALKPGQSLVKDENLLALLLPREEVRSFHHEDTKKYEQISYHGDIHKIDHPWDIFKKNGKALLADFELLTKGRESYPVSTTNRVIGPISQVFIEEGAELECAVLNTQNGPVYIGKNAQVMEGALIRGPFALCDNSVIKLGAKIYGPTTIGPESKVGGEINNSVIFGYTNKAHDGFLGNSVLGEWCNIGADSNNSNLKNNYAEVKLWSYLSERFMNTGEQFCGLIMGDHSKCAINTMFNTGTVVGVSVNLFGAGFPRTFVPSFSWGGAHGYMPYQTDKAFEVAALVMSRRNLVFEDTDKEILEEIFRMTEKYRKF